MSSDVTRVKIPMLVARDFAPRAAMTDALNSERLIKREAGLATPLLHAGLKLYDEAVAQGHGRLDMTAVVRAIEARTAAGYGDEEQREEQRKGYY